MALRADGLAADAPFSYVCHRCRRCCHDKLIQVNPYEIARLARNRGLTTGAFLRDFVEAERPYLNRREDGSCVFLGPEGCTVHPDRPLVCRVYPLGRHVVAGGAEDEARYSVVQGHSESEGVFGVAGTIADYLRGQGVEPFSVAAAAYLDALQALFDAWRARPPQGDGEAGDASPEEALPVLDLDLAVAQHCARLGIDEPTDLEARVAMHLAIIRGWAAPGGA
jgi:Fe-S-cluster containining protein